MKLMVCPFCSLPVEVVANCFTDHLFYFGGDHCPGSGRISTVEVLDEASKNGTSGVSKELSQGREPLA